MSNHNGNHGHTVTLMTVTPDTARSWLSTRPYKGQRPLRPAHVKFLAEEMQRGRFRPTTEITFAVEDGCYHLVNGNHTLNAIAMCEIPQLVTVFEYRSKDEEDTAYTYGSIDIGISRTVNDLTSALRLKEEVAFTPTQLNCVGAAVKFINSKFLTSGSKARSHADDYVRLVREYAPTAHDFFDMAAGLPKEIAKATWRTATLSVALVTLRFSAKTIGEDKIAAFWKGVIFDDGIQSNDPRKVAHRHLLTVGMTSGAGLSLRRHTMMTPQHSARVLANCFNAFVEKRSLQNTKVMDATAPIKILGSPFTGKE